MTDDILKKGLAACRSALLMVALFSFAVNVLLLTVPVYMMQVYDRVLSSQSMDTLLMLSILAVGALILLGIFDTLRQFVLTRTGVRLEAQLGGPLLASAIANRTAGDTSEIQGLRDLSQLRMFITSPAIMAVFDLPLTPFYVAIIFVIHPVLGAVTLGGAIILMLLACVNQMATGRALKEYGRHSMGALSRAQAHVRNAEAVQAMGMFPDCVRAWGEKNADAIRAQVIAGDRNALFTGLSKFLRLLLQVGILGIGGYLVLIHEMTPGMIFAGSIIGARALAPVDAAIGSWRSFGQARDAYVRIKALLNKSKILEDRISLPKPQGHVSVERLVYVPAPAARPVLKGVSFEIAPGEQIGIVGPTGAGKSTLVRLMVGALRATSGTVRLDGGEVWNWNREEFGEHVGYLPQDVELFPGTIMDNIARMRADARSEDVVEAATIANVHDMILRFPEGYETQIDPVGFALSGGQRQRIGLARAFYGSPSLLVLDEPNANLDTEGEEALLQALRTAKERGITVVLVAQRPSALAHADKILVLRDGTVDAFGPRNEVLARIVPAAAAARIAAGQSGPVVSLTGGANARPQQ